MCPTFLVSQTTRAIARSASTHIRMNVYVYACIVTFALALQRMAMEQPHVRRPLKAGTELSRDRNYPVLPYSHSYMNVYVYACIVTFALALQRMAMEQPHVRRPLKAGTVEDGEGVREDTGEPVGLSLLSPTARRRQIWIIYFIGFMVKSFIAP